MIQPLKAYFRIIMVVTNLANSPTNKNLGWVTWEIDRMLIHPPSLHTLCGFTHKNGMSFKGMMILVEYIIYTLQTWHISGNSSALYGAAPQAIF